MVILKSGCKVDVRRDRSGRGLLVLQAVTPMRSTDIRLSADEAEEIARELLHEAAELRADT